MTLVLLNHTPFRERAKSQLFRQPSGPLPQPFEMKSTLSVIQENGTEGAAKRPSRARSPARWRGSLQQSRTHIEEVEGIHRGEGCGLEGLYIVFAAGFAANPNSFNPWLSLGVLQPLVLVVVATGWAIPTT